MSPATKPLSQISEEAIQLLAREMGVADTARFIRLFHTGSGDYTQDRRERFADQSLDDLIDELETSSDQ